MKRKKRWFICLVWLSFVFISLFFPHILPAYAQEALQFHDIIKMLDHSGKTFNYLGAKFVIDYTHSGKSTFVKVTYGAPNWQKREVSQSKQGTPQIILDDGKHLWHYIPSQASVIKKKRRLSLGDISKRLHRQNELIQQNYHIIVDSQQEEVLSEEASGIPVVIGDVVVSLQPKTQDRPSWKLWIDSEHGLIVRTEIYGINGKLALLSAFSELTFQPKISKSTFKMTVPKGTRMRATIEKSFQTIEDARKEVNFPLSEPEYLPPGFSLAAVILSKTKQGKKVQLTYIDGMSSISIFEDRRTKTPQKSAEKTSNNIEINAAIKGRFYDQGLLKILRWRLEDNLQITLVGEVADSELLKIASSIIK